MNSAIIQISRNLSLALVAVSLISLSAHAKPPKEKNQLKKGNSTTNISISVNGSTATITSGKEISHVVIWYCDPLTEVKYEENTLLPHLDWTKKEATFSGSPIMSVVAKSGTSSKIYLGQCLGGESGEYNEDDR